MNAHFEIQNPTKDLRSRTRPWLLVTVTLLTTLLSSASALSKKPANVHGGVVVDGMTCPFCAFGLEKKLKALRFVENVKIFIDDGRAEFDVKEGERADFEAIKNAVTEGGFTPGATTLSVRGTVKRSKDIVTVVVGKDTVAQLEPGEKRDALVNKLGGTARQVLVKGGVTTRGTTNSIVIDSFEVL